MGLLFIIFLFVSFLFKLVNHGNMLYSIRVVLVPLVNSRSSIAEHLSISEVGLYV